MKTPNWKRGVTSEARERGVSVPRVWDVVKVDGRVGIVMERIEGDSMLRWGTNMPWRAYTGGEN